MRDQTLAQATTKTWIHKRDKITSCGESTRWESKPEQIDEDKDVIPNCCCNDC